MRPETWTTVRAWWAQVFDVATDDLWSGVTVRPHALLGDYAGWWVAWTDDGGHVSTPAGAEPLDGLTLAELRSVDHWRDFAARRGLQVLGPSVHAYLDVDPEPGPALASVTTHDLRHLRDRVPHEEWWESGWNAEPLVGLAVRRNRRYVAAANLTAWLGQPLDIGVVVDPEFRGQGLATTVGAAAASVAIRESGIARWRALETNLASRAVADRLGFEPYCRQLAIRM